MSIVLLFGAGASYGSGAVLPEPPPLGPHLFDELQRHSCAWASIPAEYASGFRADFEVGMKAYYDSALGKTLDLLALTHGMARFLGGFSCAPGNVYGQIAQAIQSSRRRVVLASLNYDLLLEEALGGEGIVFDDRMRAISRYLWRQTTEIAPATGIPLLKPHGSANFFDMGSATFAPVSPIPGRGAGEPFIDSLRPDLWRRFILGQTGRPAIMSLYMPTKEALFGTDALGEVRTILETELMQAAQVCIVGVALRPEDDHVWGPIRRTAAQINYVGPDGSTVREWCRSVGRGRFTWGGESFVTGLPTLTRMIRGN